MSSKRNTIIQTKPCHLAIVIALTLLATAPVQAQNFNIHEELTNAKEVRTWQFNIPAQPLPQALADLSAVTGLQVLYTEETTFDHAAPALIGNYSLHDALQQLLAGSGLMLRITGENSVTLQKTGSLNSGVMTLGLISVEGYIDDGFANPYTDEQKRLNTLRPDLILGGDQMQRFPDEHIGKALDRLPGLFSTSPSEKQEVRVRGLDKQFSRVEVDGVTIPGAGRWRNLSVGTVASSLVEEVRVIRNPTADIEHDGIGGRVSVKYRRIPQEFTGSTEVLGGGIRETSNDMLAGRASIWAGGPMSENFGLLGGLNINNSPSNRQHIAEQTNADGSFRESFNRIDRKDVTRINTFLKMGWELDQGYFEFEPQLFTETVSQSDVRKTQTPAHNGSDDNRFRTEESESITGGANLRLEQQLSEHWHLDSRLSWFLSDQDKTMDEIRLRYRGGALHGTPTVSNTSESLTDELLELRTALAYDWSATHLGKFELGLQARRNERDGRKSSIENGVVQNPSSGDIYNLQENYLAGWARQQFKFLDETLRVEPGVRIEDYRLNALSNDGQGGNNTQSSHHLHIGPSLHTAWRISPQMTLQGAISRTLNRPQLDQITPSREQKGQEIVVGNPDLNPATAINSDLGLVWSTPDLFLAATIFHKKIDDLIVNSLTGEQEGSRNIVQPINIESGTLRGLELEQRYHLGATGIRQFDGLTIWSNQTLFDGKMRLASGRHVPFFGEPDYLLAAGIDWISPSSNLQMSLAINHNGKRTEEDEFSRKRFDKLTTVDLTAAYAINRDIRLRFEASNLFNEQESGPKSFFNANHELTHVEHRTVSIPQTLWLGFDMKF